MSENVITGTMTQHVHSESGDLFLTIKVDKDHLLTANSLFNQDKAPVALVRMKETAKTKGQYGKYAKELHRSGFFRIEYLWGVLGTDTQYLEWLKTQPCAISGDEGWEENPIVPAHVRRVTNGAGTGFKPRYSAIPLTNSVHQLQHQHGEEHFHPREWWDKQRITHVERWAKIMFKKACQVESLADLSPARMRYFAKNLHVYDYVPAIYKERT